MSSTGGNEKVKIRFWGAGLSWKMFECEGIGERAKDQMKGWAGQGREGKETKDGRRGEEKSDYKTNIAR